MNQSKRTVFVVIILAAVTVLVLALLFMKSSDDRSPTTNKDVRSISDRPLPDTTTTDTDPNQVQPSDAGTVITTGRSEYGTILLNEKKQAIYIWELDDTSTPECYGDCAVAWPPVLTEGDPRAIGEVNGALLGTIKRTDGSIQVTYNGHPLYYYAHEGPGEVKCHNISTHGGLWWAVQPNGNRAK